MAICYNGLGEKVLAKRYFSLAKEKMEKKVENSPDDYRTHAGLAIVYSHLGLKEDAVREAKTALAILPPSKDSFFGVYQVLSLAYVYMTNGDYDAAIDQLESIKNEFGGIKIEHIENQPQWSQLKNHPRIMKWKDNEQRS